MVLLRTPGFSARARTDQWVAVFGLRVRAVFNSCADPIFIMGPGSLGLQLIVRSRKTLLEKVRAPVTRRDTLSALAHKFGDVFFTRP